MASFTDQLIPFNPYIQELPVEDYVRVGLLKQGQYEQGVQTIQGQIDSIAGLRLARDVDKQYLNESLNNLESQVKRVAAADFSRPQVVSAVGGLTRQIASDKYIQRAVQSTARYQSELAKMEKAQTDGKSSPANDWAFQNQAAKWLSSKDLREGFNGSYTEFYDIQKAAKDVLDQLRQTPSGSTRSEDYLKLDPKTGQYVPNEVMFEESMKGVDPQRVRDALGLVLSDPRAQQQMQIDAAYQYRNYDKQALFEENKASYQQALDRSNKEIAKLTLIANNGTEAEKVKANEHLKAEKENVESMLLAYNRDVQLLDQDPESFKVSLHGRNLQQRYANVYSYKQESTKIMTNPLFSAWMDQLKYDLDVDKYNLDVLKEQRLSEEAARKANEEKKTKEKEGSFFETAVPRPIDKGTPKGKTAFDAQTRELEKVYGNEVHTFINHLFDDDPNTAPYIFGDNGKLYVNTKERNPQSVYNTEEEARRAGAEQFIAARDAYNKGTATQGLIKDFFKRNNNLLNYVNDRRAMANQIEQKYATRLAPLYEKLKQSGIPESITFKSKAGDDLRVSIADAVDYNIFDKDIEGKGAEARQRLIDRLGEEGFQKLNKEFAPPEGVVAYGGVVSRIVNPKLEEYLKKVKTSDLSTDFINTYSTRDTDYSKLQTDFQNLEARFKTDEAADRRKVIDLVRRIVSNKSKQSGGIGNDVEAEDVTELLDQDLKNPGQVTYGIFRDRRNNQSYITLSKGDGSDEVSIPITDQQAEAIPGIRLLDPFYQTFGRRFMGEGYTTDPQRLGHTTAITPPSQNGGNFKKYTVRTHLRKVGDQYEVRLYIFDKELGKWRAEGKPLNTPRADFFSKDDVMDLFNNMTEAAVEKFLTDNHL